MSARTIGEELWARRGDHRPGLLDGDDAWTWAEVVRESSARAALLDELLDGRPDARSAPHVGVLLDNVPDYVFWVGAAALSGATLAGINPTHGAEQLAAEVRHVDLDVIVTDAAGQARLAGLDLGLAPDRFVLVDDPAYVARVAELRVREPHLAPEAREPSTRLLLLFTSGTTGASKAAICSQGRLLSLGRLNRDRFPLTADDVCYCPMPLFHGNALMALWAPALVAGASVALTPRFSASGFLADVRRYRATFFTYVGRAISYVLATPVAADDHDNTLTHGFGTEASPEDVALFRERFGCRLLEGYGSSEAGGLITLAPDGPPTALGRPARPSVIVVDPDTRTPCPPADVDQHGRVTNADQAVGEIVDTEGAGRFEGYYNNPEANAERVRHGWYWTGDLGFTDAAGFLYFAGRAGDWIRVDSENISALATERVLRRHPAVLTAGVFAVPDPRSGDQVMAAIETPDALFEDLDLAGFLAAQPDLGSKGAPRFIRVARHLPVTGSGKLRKKDLQLAGWRTDDPVYRWVGRGAPHYVEMTQQDKDELRQQFVANGRARFLP